MAAMLVARDIFDNKKQKKLFERNMELKEHILEERENALLYGTPNADNSQTAIENSLDERLEYCTAMEDEGEACTNGHNS